VALVTPEFVFIHVPRTGGTSTRSGILAKFPDAFDTCPHRGPCPCAPFNDACGVPIPPEQHIAASKLERRENEYLARRMIGFVRHPVTWYASMWSWAKRTNFAAKIPIDPLAERHWLADVWADELGEFLERVIALAVPRAWVVFHEKLTRTDGSLCEVGRYESLRWDLLRLTGCSVEHRLRQTHAKSKTEITPARRAAIASLERETISKFYRDCPQTIAEEPA
jgi:hypothetical protein